MSTVSSGGNDDDDGRVRVVGGTPAEVGHAAFVHGVELHELTAEASRLEQAFLEMTEGDQSS